MTSQSEAKIKMDSGLRRNDEPERSEDQDGFRLAPE
jgi:hypothetical protein